MRTYHLEIIHEKNGQPAIHDSSPLLPDVVIRKVDDPSTLKLDKPSRISDQSESNARRRTARALVNG